MKTVLSILIVFVLLIAALPALAQDPVWPTTPPRGGEVVENEEPLDLGNGEQVDVSPDGVYVDPSPCIVITSEGDIYETLCEDEPGNDATFDLTPPASGRSGSPFHVMLLPWNIWR